MTRPGRLPLERNKRPEPQPDVLRSSGRFGSSSPAAPWSGDGSNAGELEWTEALPLDPGPTTTTASQAQRAVVVVGVCGSCSGHLAGRSRTAFRTAGATYAA